jgi:NAD(P)H dehydrogenase (quinone)
MEVIGMYAVMGITGQVGAAVAEQLLSAGEKVRAVVRNPEKAAAWKARGVELATADYEDAAGLEAAFRGADGVFAMIPPYFAPSPDLSEPKAAIAAVRTALDRARPAKAVYLSSIGAQQTSGIGLIAVLHLLEEAFSSLPIPAAFLRAGWFMENCAWDVAPARDQGKLFSYLQPLDHTFALVATTDIGRAGAETLRQKWTGNRTIEVAGPRRYSPNDIAAAFASALGRKVEAVIVPRETWVSTFVAQGAPEDRTALRVEMIDAFNSGRIDFGVPGTESFAGTTDLKQVIETLVSR